VDLPRYDFDPKEARPGRADILFLPIVAWTYRRQRPQQLAEALARQGRRVFYGALQGPGEPNEATPVAPGVLLLPIAGVRREDPADRKFEGKALETAFDSLARARQDYAMYETALLVESPFWTPLALRLRERFGWKVVYDCLDEHAGFATNRPGLLASAEEELVLAADLVVATSEVLLERLQERKSSARLLPNACDEELFATVPDPVAKRGGLTVGYVGALDDWFDADLFQELTRLRPDWRFEIVGGFEGRGKAWPTAANNVILHGERPHRELPKFRSSFDVEIIPFRRSVLTDAVNSVKFYEAAAAGRPVVATPMRSLLPFARQELVRLAETATDFVREIQAAAAHGPATAARLRAFARENTWDRRASQLQSWVQELYAPAAVPRGLPSDLPARPRAR